MQTRIDAAAIGLTLTGAIIGAGFASGQEIAQFFARYGSYAYAGALVSIAAFAFFLGLLTSTCQRHQLATLEQLLVHWAGISVGHFFAHLLTLFLWLGLAVMLAGSVSVLTSFFCLPPLLAALLTAGLVYFVCRRRTAGLAAANELLMPILLFLLLFFWLRSCFLPQPAPISAEAGWLPITATVRHWQTTHAALSSSIGWLPAAILYMAFNSAILLAIVPPLAAAASDRRAMRRGTAIALLLLCILLFCIIYLLERYADLVSGTDMPMLVIAQYLLPHLPWLYAVLLFIALLTTAFADTLGIAQHLEQRWPHLSRPALAVAILAAAGLAQCGFAPLVAVLYPLKGYLCLFFYIFCLLRHIVILF